MMVKVRSATKIAVALILLFATVVAAIRVVGLVYNCIAILDAQMRIASLNTGADIKWAIAPRFDEAGSFSEGRAEAIIGGDLIIIVVINTSGSIVGVSDHNAILHLSLKDGFLWISTTGSRSLVDLKGSKLPLRSYRNAWEATEGLILVNNEYGYKNGFIDEDSGGEAIPLIYSEARSFSEGLAAVKKDGKWSCIDMTGLLMKAKYPTGEYADYSYNGLGYLVEATEKLGDEIRTLMSRKTKKKAK